MENSIEQMLDIEKREKQISFSSNTTVCLRFREESITDFFHRL